MATIDLINALLADDTTAGQEQFDKIMSEKVQAGLEAFRTETAQTLFKESELAEGVDLKVSKPTGSLNQGLKHNVTHKGKIIGHITQWHDGDGGTEWSGKHIPSDTHIKPGEGGQIRSKEQAVRLLAQEHEKHLEKSKLKESV